MCGIVGYSGSFDELALRRALLMQVHRGPDDRGLFFDSENGIGLGHARLSILDLSPLGHQPMLSDDGRVALVFNGEIYNFHALRTELENKGQLFRGHSDTEVLLQLYLTEGISMLPRLNGIFAFAIWDQRERSLFIARDALGVKPLYYAVTSHGYAFASEIKGLLPLIPEARKLDAMALHRYLSFLWCPGEGTPLKVVRKLPPGEAMIVRQGGILHRWAWYSLPVCRGTAPDLSKDLAIDGIASYLRRAVQRQLVADVPVGAFLSGGLDSSAVVAMAVEQMPHLRCFTIESADGAEKGTTDDLPYARRAAKHLRVPLDVISIDSARMSADLERMVYQLDEPLADPAPLNVLYISRLAREHGMKVLLSGAGGDDLFTGYRRHLALRYEPFWLRLPLKMRAALQKLAEGLDQRRSLFRRLAKWSAGAERQGDARLTSYFLWTRESHLLPLYSKEFREAIGEIPVEQPMLDFLAALPQSASKLERVLALEQRFFLADHNLNYTDKMSMAAGVEVRVPFLDLELVEFAARIPASLKQKGTQGKWILKKAMERYLPNDLIYRPKSGFGAPLRRWMRHELRPLLDDMLSEESLRRRGIFDPVAVQRLVVENHRGRIDAAYTMLSLLCIEIWCRRFLDRAPLSTSAMLYEDPGS